jgi:hypothetical protein
VLVLLLLLLPLLLLLLQAGRAAGLLQASVAVTAAGRQVSATNAAISGSVTLMMLTMMTKMMS